MAHELGLFRKYGLRVNLHRELGWATVRDKIVHGELDAAHALAAMPLAATLGLGSVPCNCLTGLVLNLHGNAITLSRDLWLRGVRDGESLRREIIRRRPEKKFTFGAVAPFSSHHFLLRKWLVSLGIHPERDVHLAIVPPPLMVANLNAGHLDGFCVGEPWNSVAAQNCGGWCAAVSAQLAPGHPEKVVMVRREFAEKRSAEHLALLAGLLEACEFCDQVENQTRLVSTLARPEYVGAPTAALLSGIRGELDFGGGAVRVVRDFAIFHRDDANEPSGRKAAWVFEQMRPIVSRLFQSSFNVALSRELFRIDLFEKASQLRNCFRSAEPPSSPTFATGVAQASAPASSGASPPLVHGPREKLDGTPLELAGEDARATQVAKVRLKPPPRLCLFENPKYEDRHLVSESWPPAHSV
jgi:ABC-type nitrate/sulfonate/bicarbonate transport system substrate-binding protein